MAQATDQFRLVSSNIDHEGRLPRKYTGGGQGMQRNKSPPLEWHNVPDGTKSLALIVEDLGEPGSEHPVPFTQWVVVNIPPKVKGFPEDFSGKEETFGGDYAEIKEGVNDLKIPGWCGTMLPEQGHRFLFTLYALDTELHFGNKVTKDRVCDLKDGHVLAEATLVAHT